MYKKGTYRDANFQGPGISTEYSGGKEFRQKIYEPAMRAQFPDVFDFEKPPQWNSSDAPA
jgi:hypothetical protein